MIPSSTTEQELETLAQNLIKQAQTDHIMIATAESCTGGLIAGCLTEIAGSSAVFERGFVTYSNQAKMEVLNVPAQMLALYGAVSHQVASAMVEGALHTANAQLAVSVTGIAGPGGGTEEKPVGLVYIGVQKKGRSPRVEKHLFLNATGSNSTYTERKNIRLKTIKAALSMMLQELQHP